MQISIYHNPRCSKSRQTLSILKQRKVDLEIIEYLKTPPSATELAHILKMLGLKPRELMRKHEAAYKNNNLGDSNLSDEQLINAMIKHPILIERPIVVANDRAIIGRPPENVMELLS